MAILGISPGDGKTMQMHAKFLRTGFLQAFRPAFVAMNGNRAKIVRKHLLQQIRTFNYLLIKNNIIIIITNALTKGITP